MRTHCCHRLCVTLLTKINKERTMNLQQTGELANKAAAVQWVKWVHPNTEPANSNEEKRANTIIATIIHAREK